MGMEKLLSIIVPAYNGEKYLEKCITSIIDQSYKNLEIILIDDKSPDLSGEICEKFAMKDDRIKVFHNKENMGIYGTRNKGISIASGDYVTFVDDDDYIEKTMYQKMMQKFEENQEVDLVLCNFENIRETGAKIGKSREKEGKYFKDEIRKDFLYRLIGNQEIACAVWRCIFKKEKIIENDIKFIASRVKDDMCFFLQYILAIDSLYCVEECLYNYITYASSTINTLGIGNIQDAMTIPNYYYEILKKYNMLDSKMKSNMGIEYIKSYMAIRKNCDDLDIYRKLNDPNFRKSMKWEFFFAMKGKHNIIYLLLILRLYGVLDKLL